MVSENQQTVNSLSRFWVSKQNNEALKQAKILQAYKGKLGGGDKKS